MRQEAGRHWACSATLRTRSGLARLSKLTACFRSKDARTSHNLKPSAKNESSAFLQLPIDIVLCLVDHLPEETLLCLALTCKPLYAIVSSKSRCIISQRGKRAFLQLLEGDVPGTYYCYDCDKLRPVPQYRVGDRGEDVCPNHPDNGAVLDIGNYRLPYRAARLVMNRHLYGPEHGIPLRNIEKRTRYYFPSLGVERREYLRARIIDDELFIRMEITMEHLRGDTQVLRRFVDGCNVAVCLHLDTGNQDYSRLACLMIPTPKRIKHLAEEPTPGAFSPCEEALTRCKSCSRDVVTTIKWRGYRKQGWIVRVVAYTSLGKCRDQPDIMASNYGAWIYPAYYYLIRMDPTTSVRPPRPFTDSWLEDEKGVVVEERKTRTISLSTRYLRENNANQIGMWGMYLYSKQEDEGRL